MESIHVSHEFPQAWQCSSALRKKEEDECGILLFLVIHLLICNSFIFLFVIPSSGFPGGTSGKEPSSQSRKLMPGPGKIPGVGEATRSRILAWRIPWRKKSGRLQFIGCKESDRTEAT